MEYEILPIERNMRKEKNRQSGLPSYVDESITHAHDNESMGEP